MNRMLRLMALVAIVAVCLPLLGGCGPAGQVVPQTFEKLAGHVPPGIDQVFFFNFKPSGDVGHVWQALQERLGKTAWGQDALESLLAEFKVGAFHLEDVAAGPAVSGYQSEARYEYTILQVRDGRATVEAMHAPTVGIAWQKEVVDGQEVFYGRGPNSYGSPRTVAWAVRDDLLYIASAYEGESRPDLQDLLAVAQPDSLAAQPGWQMLHGRFGANAVALLFLTPPPYDPAPSQATDVPRADLLGRNVEAAALSVIPHEDALEIQIDGTLVKDADQVPEIRAVYDLPAVDPAGWPGLPAGTAVAIIATDASTIWPWMRDLLTLNLQGLDTLRDSIGLDVEVDLWGPDGPLTGPFAAAILPPLPDQPITAGLPAAQVLFVAPEASDRDANRLRAAMEERGAIFGPVVLDEMVLQQQVGTAASGYALSYTRDRGILYLGSSPTVVTQAATLRPGSGGLADDETFRRVTGMMPAEPFVFVYVDGRATRDLLLANSTGDENSATTDAFDSFSAMGLGLRLNGQDLRGKAYFLLANE